MREKVGSIESVQTWQPYKPAHARIWPGRKGQRVWSGWACGLWVSAFLVLTGCAATGGAGGALLGYGITGNARGAAMGAGAGILAGSLFDAGVVRPHPWYGPYYSPGPGRWVYVPGHWDPYGRWVPPRRYWAPY